MVETINKLVRVQRQLLQDLGRDPTPEEIGAEMDMSADRVREIQKISQEPVSLETPIGEEEDSQLGDFIEDSQRAKAGCNNSSASFQGPEFLWALFLVDGDSSPAKSSVCESWFTGVGRW